MTKRLDPHDREFFELVSRATFTNPFGPERDALDARIAGVEGSPASLLERMVERVKAKNREQTPMIRQFSAEDRTLIEHSVLFEVFHRFAPALDHLIALQLEAGVTPVETPFAEELLGQLVKSELDEQLAPRRLALMWQLRRAYRFIAGGLVGSSPSMRRFRERLWNNIFTHDLARFERVLWDRLEDFSVMLVGETGTGKGQAAAAIGRSGHIPYDTRRQSFAFSFTDLFVPINLSEFSESLLESELFGHQKGAFTGAIGTHQGLLTQCPPHGALFLDEIGEVHTPIQVKLLRVLQERRFSPVGSHELRRFEGRVIAATHRDLARSRADGSFRDDFYYRLCSDVVQVPTLRERVSEDPNELDELLSHLVTRIVGHEDPAFASLVREIIEKEVPRDHPWPGNVRELEQCVRRVLLTGSFEPAPTVRSNSNADALAKEMSSGSLQARTLVARYCALLYEREGSYEKVAQVTGLDRRTVRKYILGMSR